MPNAREVQQLIESWQQELSATVQQVQCIDEPITWSEAATEPYFTIPLEVERYAALVLLAAYTELPKSKFGWSSKLPTELHRDWFNDAQLRRALESDTPRTFSHLYRPDLWLPVPLRIPVKTPGPTGQTIICGSSQILQQQLNDLASAASPTFDRQLATENALVGYARSGLQLLRHMASKSIQHRLPMLLYS